MFARRAGQRPEEPETWPSPLVSRLSALVEVIMGIKDTGTELRDGQLEPQSHTERGSGVP